MSRNEKDVAERQVINEAKAGWRIKLYNEAYRRREIEDPEATREALDRKAFEAVANALEGSLSVKKQAVIADLSDVRSKRNAESDEADEEGEEDGEFEDEAEVYEE